MRDADFYLENMPIAFCAVEILTGEDGRPVDYCLVYHNRAYARLAGLPYGTLNGKRGLEVRGHIDQELLMCCYDSAFHGKEHVLKDYSPDQEKHFLIYLYPLEDSLCGCVLQDVTENRRMELKLIHEHEKRKTFLKATTEIDFEYDFATETLAFGDGERVSEKNRVIKGGLKGLVENGIIREKDRGRIEDAFERLKAGNRAVEFNIQACLEGGGEYRWYAVSSSAYVEQKTGQLRVVGYLRNVEQMIKAQAALKKEAMYDPLVDLYNVKTGKEMVTEALENMEAGGEAIMFMMDIDNFKKLNDTYGHLAGDEVLIGFADILRRNSRSDDICARLGGDEFLVYFPGLKKKETAVERAEMIARQFLEKNGKNYEDVEISVSIGIVMRSGEREFGSLYEAADRALYQVKNRGKGGYMFADGL